VRKTFLIISAILLIIFGILFIIAGVANEQKLSQFKKQGVATQGIVTEKKAVHSGETVQYQLEVNYMTKQGIEHSRIFYVDEDDFQHAEVMQNIPVIYVPEKPEWVVIGENFSYDRRPFYLGIVIFLFGLLILFLVFPPQRLFRSKGL